ncbi:PREDICTED: uncharacterized protein LOC100633843 isoform X3 [Amphimedon queenslandica]|uniref:Peptidase S8/S53 domain-containing protein n=1 Tax=Amphimedon queenslandica TaxID=400682 RepID=A0AAN0IX86_AMPQE|nr:PREDICTED: uncharacterized protein LOC100633843 isoform X3 [Amphimedon queenslandica]|eukprot:XP_019849379.1 PREDICTED: uncharacterized protein LOC100633843 isoform X3 [Amphimedon queenslandica]
MASSSKSAVFLILFSLLGGISYVESRRVIRAAPGEETTGNYIVVMEKETSHSTFEHIADEVRNESMDHKIAEKVEGPVAKIIAAKMTEEAAHRLKHQLGVEYIEQEAFATMSAVSWAVDRVDQVSSVLDNQPYTPCECGNGVDVYVLDTGIRYNHCEFGGRALYPGYDPVDNYNGGNRQGGDCQGHGTHVASLAVGNVSGLARCATAYSVRVLDCNGRGPYSVIIDGLNYVAGRIRSSNRTGVISMSLGGSFSSSLDQVVTNVVSQGIPVVASAGNDRGNACSKSPASNPGAITVAGSARGDNVYFNTNAGSCVDIFAPGASVTAASHSCSTCSCLRTLSGTSMAAPLVSGGIALLLEKEPSLSPAAISNRLKQNCIKNAISYTNLPVTYRSNTNNCLLHVNTDCSDDNSTCTKTRTFTFTQMTMSTRLVTETRISNIVTTATVTVTRSTDVTRTHTVAVTERITPTVTTCPGPTPTSTPVSGFASCAEVSGPSGNYVLQTKDGPTTVYCELEKEIKGNRGFMRIANVNMSDPNTDCPDSLSLRTDGNLRTCQRDEQGKGCSSAHFNTSGFEYSKVCGRIRGYQWASPNAFYWYQRNKRLTINDLYVDGAVLTNQVNESRSHIWTFAAAIDEVGRSGAAFDCQCTNREVIIDFETPSFVGNDYFCETGSRNFFEYNTFYTADPLWDGKGCGEVSTCCDKGEWFCKDVPKTSSDIELRLCGNEERFNEDTPLDLIELYVK